jgi:hypothetical protein
MKSVLRRGLSVVVVAISTLGIAGIAGAATSKALTDNGAAALSVADTVYYEQAAMSSKKSAVTVAMYASLAKSDFYSGVKAVTVEGPRVALFTFKIGPAVCVTTTTTPGPMPKVVTCTPV